MHDLENLLQAIRTTDDKSGQKQAAFSDLVRHFQDMVYGCAYSIMGDHQLAQDVGQEAFMIAYQQIGQLRDPKAFPGWLRRIVLTQCHRLLRTQRLHTQSLESATAFAANELSPSAMLEAAEVRAIVLAAIQALPATQRMATILFYIDGYSQQEVAAFLEISVDTVKKRLERARTRLRERMIDMVQEELHEQRPSNSTRLIEAIHLAAVLEEAAHEGQLATLELLLVDGLSVDAKGQDGQTLLHWAAQKGDIDAVELLLHHRATITSKDKLGKTPLQLAQEGGHQQVMALLHKQSAKGQHSRVKGQ